MLPSQRKKLSGINKKDDGFIEAIYEELFKDELWDIAPVVPAITKNYDDFTDWIETEKLRPNPTKRKIKCRHYRKKKNKTVAFVPQRNGIDKIEINSIMDIINIMENCQHKIDANSTIASLRKNNPKAYNDYINEIHKGIKISHQKKGE